MIDVTKSYGNYAEVPEDLRDSPEQEVKVREAVLMNARFAIPSPCWHRIKVIVHYPLDWSPASWENPSAVGWKYKPVCFPLG